MTIEIAEAICSILDEVRPISDNDKGLTSYQQLIIFVQDRPGYDFSYAIDDTSYQRENLVDRRLVTLESICERLFNII